MNIRLVNVSNITSKKDGKKYIIYTLLCENDVLIKSFIAYNVEIEKQLLSMLWKEVSDHISFQLDKKNSCYRPYIDL